MAQGNGEQRAPFPSHCHMGGTASWQEHQRGIFPFGGVKETLGSKAKKKRKIIELLYGGLLKAQAEIQKSTPIQNKHEAVALVHSFD